MRILGLHFGHDAAATIIEDGKVIAYVMRERISRIKHALGLDSATINQVLADADLSISDIDYVAISSTQRKELIFTEHEALTIRFERHPAHQDNCSLLDNNDTSISDYATQLNNDLKAYLLAPEFRDSQAFKTYSLFYPEYADAEQAIELASGWLDQYIEQLPWQTLKTLEQIGEEGFADFTANETVRKGFHLPVTVDLFGETLPGYFIHHHMCHAASTFYTSDYQDAGIITHDGHSRPSGYDVGMFYYGTDHKIFPLAPHHLFLGALYDSVGVKLNLGLIGPAGKLMGLSSWGKNVFSFDEFVGNFADFTTTFDSEDYRTLWFEHCLKQAEAQGYDFEPLSDKKQMTAAINADIALTTQKLFEASYLAAASALHTGLSKTNANNGTTTNLCLSGGTALNCPSNSQLWQQSAFENVYIEPCCDDSGIAIGAALALYHNVLDNPRLPQGTSILSAYPGSRWIADQDKLLQQYPGQFTATAMTLTDAAAHAASALAADKTVCWFEGQSEIGPRALGHRSILANPSSAENWARVNHIKGRELWRPFAPIVLADDAAHWFEGCPLPSPYMLFTAQVKKDDVPAITHVDNSSRIQTVDESCGGVFSVLTHFKANTGIAVLMNTSFNGPGEPIVETPANALAFFADTAIDLLYIDGILFEKKPSKA